MNLTDMEGRPLKVGQVVLYPHVVGRSTPRITKRVIERIAGGKVYLSPGRFSDRSAPLQVPERLYIIAEPEAS